jgi:hypothetical protein
MHPYSSRAFQSYQEHDEGHHGLGDLNVTNKQTNKQPSFTDRNLVVRLMHVRDVPQPKITPFSFASINYCKLFNVIHPLLRSQVFNKPQNVKFHLRDLVLV